MIQLEEATHEMQNSKIETAPYETNEEEKKPL
jgi:hypothetical protein